MENYSELGPEKSSRGKKNLIVAVTSSVVAVSAVAAVIVCLLITKNKQNEPDFAAEEVVSIPQERICGNYDIRFDYADSVARFVGVVDCDINGDYTLTVLSDMAPRVLTLQVDDNGRIWCDELGAGTMSYKQSTDRTRIKFLGEGYICTLTK